MFSIRYNLRPRTPCTCCCKLLPNASNAESREGGGGGGRGGEFEITLKETKMKKRDNGRPGLSCSKADYRLTRVSFSCVQKHFLG